MTAVADLLPMIQAGLLAGCLWALRRLVGDLDRVTARLEKVDRRLSFLEGRVDGTSAFD